MLYQLTNKALQVFGLKLVRIPSQPGNQGTDHRALEKKVMSDTVEAIKASPLDANLHIKLADSALKVGNAFLAHAELKSAKFLGAEANSIAGKLQESRSALPNLITMNHNQHFRLESLATELISRAGRKDVSVLDVGGGNGELSAFLPDSEYCLVEPTVNGLSGTELPFPDEAFDYVVSCHVLEHIPVEQRELFLDQLLSKARYGVVLLNPFHVEGTHVEERLKLFIKLTGAQWAKEHLECALPEVGDIEAYASKRGLKADIKPNGCQTTSVALVFVDYFASRSGLRDKWGEFNQFFNEKFTPIHVSDTHPNAYMAYIEKRPQE